MAIVAIVGRPNVGKSTLFNYLIGERRAIVGPERGITRDRLYGKWQIDEETVVDLVDTGGFDTIPGEELDQAMRNQTLAAIDDADIILCVFDALAGITPDDEELVKLLRQSSADPIFVANKMDDPNAAIGVSQLYELGLDGFVEIAAAKKKGRSRIINAVKKHIDRLPPEVPVDYEGAIRVSILGRPNVGKSMLTNRLIGEERAIVSSVAGTTRDYVDIPLERNGQKYVFVDTAGIRRRARIDDKIEKFSVSRSIRNINNSQVCLFLMDPQEGMTEQDRRLCGLIMEEGKAFAVVVNKSDLLTPDERARVEHQLKYSLRFMPDLRVIFISALQGKNIKKIYKVVDDLYEKTTRETSTANLNKVLAQMTEAKEPPVVKRRRLKFYYINQVGSVPPRFRIVTSKPKEVPENYSRYLINGLKKRLGLEGISVKVTFAGR